MWTIDGSFDGFLRQIWEHPLLTAVIFFVVYAQLASLRERLQWQECTLAPNRSDRPGIHKPMKIAGKILSR